MKEQIETIVLRTLADAGAKSTGIKITRPPNSVRADYAFYVGIEFAEATARNLKDRLGSAISNVDITHTGFINITLSKEAVEKSIREAAEGGEKWGRVKGGGDKVMVEYTDPNPFKEMHIGHLMSNAIGEAIARLVENEGAEIARANYQGDVGPHVAKALWGLMQMGITEPESAKELGEAYAKGAKAHEDDPTAKGEIDELNKAIYASTDHALMELWKRGRDVSLAAFERLYKILGTKFDYYFFESEVAASGTEVVQDGLKTGIFEESDGAIIYKGEKKGLHTLVFITSRGTPTYEAKELGLAFLKEERWPSDRSIVITANEQTGHFNVVLAALSEVGPLLAKKTTHVAHGFLRLATGKMSSREGNVITAASLLEDVMKKASEKNADPLIAEQVAVGAIKYMILRQAPGGDIIFDPEKSLSLEGDSGPYLQYALVRAKKILTYAEGKGGDKEPEVPYDIERLIIHYPEVAARAARELAPNLLTTYLTELAGAWNSFYAKEQVLGSPEEAYKMRLTQVFANTLANGLRLLGIPTPDKM